MYAEIPSEMAAHTDLQCYSVCGLATSKALKRQNKKKLICRVGTLYQLACVLSDGARSHSADTFH